MVYSANMLGLSSNTMYIHREIAAKDMNTLTRQEEAMTNTTADTMNVEETITAEKEETIAKEMITTIEEMTIIKEKTVTLLLLLLVEEERVMNNNVITTTIMKKDAIMIDLLLMNQDPIIMIVVADPFMKDQKIINSMNPISMLSCVIYQTMLEKSMYIKFHTVNIISMFFI